MAQRLNLCLKRLGADSQGIGLAGSVDIGKDDFISQTQSLGEIFHKCLGSGVSMRLEDTPERFVRIIGRCMQGGCNLCGMVGIIIDDSDAADSTLVFESAVGAGEAVQSGSGNITTYLQQISQCNGGNGVTYGG